MIKSLYVCLLALGMLSNGCVADPSTVPPRSANPSASNNPVVPPFSESFTLASTSMNQAKDIFAATWYAYKTKYITKDGRLIDSYHKISHTEGQGTAMLFSVVSDDEALFNNVWSWTKKNMQRKDHLFSWRWDAAASPPITDYNNASDGDILIAWALLKAYQRWGVKAYLSEAQKILTAIKDILIVNYAGYSVVMPGSLFFETDEHLTLNFSYFILPAFVDFSTYDDSLFWEKVYTDSVRLITLTQTTDLAVATDWINLSYLGKLSLSSKHDAKAGYDAIRVPLYLSWCGHDEVLQAYRSFWQTNGDWKTAPSWVDLLTGEQSDYPPEPGFLSIRALAFRDLPDGREALHRLYPVNDYFSASLVLFSLLADMDTECRKAQSS